MKDLNLKKEMFTIVGADIYKSEEVVTPSLTYWDNASRRLKENKIAIISIAILIIIIVLAIFAPIFSQYDYSTQDYKVKNQDPSMQHFFGTDNLGRDLWVRCWMGARVSLFIALVSTIINVTIGIIYGGISGYFGGNVDLIMMRIIEIIYSVPGLLWVILLMVVMGPGLKTIIISISLTGWGGMARIVRGQILQLKQMEYVLAAKKLGAGSLRIIKKHLIPNTMGPIIINLTFQVPGAIFTEAALSYIGLGLPVPFASWGTLANEGTKILKLYPTQLLFPALLISITMLSFNLLGDGFRDALDPKLIDE